MSKLLPTLRKAFENAGLRDGMTLSFHHHLRAGDRVLNLALDTAAAMGVRNLTIQASSIFPVHAPLVNHMRSGVVTGLETAYISGPVGEAISHGVLDKPVIFRSHGGRAAAVASGKAPIDIAVIASPACDEMGNINGVDGPAACGSLGYAMPDAQFARHVIAVTDTLRPYPLCPASIDETRVDTVVKLDSIGDPQGIVSGTTAVTRDPVGLAIAQYASEVFAHSGLMNPGFSFQTGAGGATLAVTEYLKPLMRKRGVTASFGMGGIAGAMVDMLENSYVQSLLDVQCFDLRAVRSLRDNPKHMEISALRYASPSPRGAAVEQLDFVALGATQIDTDFNVNVHTDSSGVIMGGSGGHSDTAAGAKLAVVLAPLFRARLPVVVDRVLCVSTPGDAVDALVTQRGIAINPKNAALRDRLTKAGLPVMDIHDLRDMARRVTGDPAPLAPFGRAVAKVEYRDGAIIDEIHQIIE